MIKFAYVVTEDEAGFTKYIEVTLNGYRSEVILDGVNPWILETHVCFHKTTLNFIL